MQKPNTSLLLFISLVANLFLGAQLYQRDSAVNRFTWGNATTQLFQHIDWVSHEIAPGSDGRVSGTAIRNIYLALEDLEELQHLPFYGQRTRWEEMNTLRHLLHYAERAHGLAQNEQGESGQVSPESKARLLKIQEGLQLAVRGHARSQDLADTRFPWNHGAWREMWREIADGLRQIDFVPLPE